MFARITVILLLVFSILCTGAWAQNPPTQAQTIPHKIELNIFGGGSFFEQGPGPFREKLVNGGIVGFQLSHNISDRWAIEPSVNVYGVNNLRFNRGVQGTLDLGSRVFAVALNPVFHFTNKYATVRPFITAGIGSNVYFPTRDAKRQVDGISDPILRASLESLDTSTQLTLNYGFGIKVRMTQSGRWALRYDVRGLYSDNPKFHLLQSPSAGAIYIPDTDSKLHGLQATLGISFNFGKDEIPTIVNVPGPERIVTTNAIVVSQIQGTAEVCGGTQVPLSVTVSAPTTVSYQWALNGANVGTNANNYTLTVPDNGGDQTVTLRITDTSADRPAAPVTLTYTVRGRAYVRPTVQVTPNSVNIDAGQSTTLGAAGAGDCGGALTYAWTASEGTVTGNNAQATFNSATVNFPTANQDQVKPITVTATVRDTRGGTATGTATVNVRKPVESVRMPDVLFTANGTRVNNCGQRILLDEVLPRLRTLGNNYTVVLVGHRADGERGTNLDRDRVYNAARVLVGGAGTQTRLERQRLKVDWVGTSAGSASEPGYCGTSARTGVQERGGQTIAQGSGAENRRVEVWLVPNNLMPASATNPRDLPANVR